MKVVWSFWSKPYLQGHGFGWASGKYHLLAWVLSVGLARKHYPDIALITDETGAGILIDGLELPFDSVDTSLETLDDRDPRWWILGKLYAYRSQSEPFVHLDTDVFLWEPLPGPLVESPVFAQSFEYFTVGENSWYIPAKIESEIRNVGGWVPEEMEEYLPERGRYKAICCGLLGGNRTDFLQYYADLAIRFIESPENQPGWLRLGNTNCVTVEQYLLAACLAYHQDNPDSPFHDIDIRCLFSSTQEAFNPVIAEPVGYTHLIGGAKGNTRLLERLESRVREEYPDQYDLCMTYAETGIV